VRRIEGDELLEKGHQPYVYETLRLPAGAIYLSEVSLGRDGEPAGRPQPNLQVAAPVYDPHEQVRGLVVINVDLQGLFRQLSADLPSALQLYLLNSKGDYLIHPDPAKAFAFDRGQSENVQQQFPETLALLDGSTPRLHERVTRSAGAAGRVAAFVRQPPIDLRLEEEFIIGLSQPLGEVLKEGDRVGQVNVRLVLAFSALAVLLAVLLARALSRPINQIVAAVRSFSAGLPAQDNALPCERSDEIGVLARSVQDMQHQIRSQFAKLQEKQAEMDRLASHDSLTGLLNRRVFLDRLEHAMAHAKRSQCRLALLFIDLDRFKPINDSLGHAAGDVLLKTLAERLQQLVRAADTVARIGGDEFIVLLDPAGPQLDATVVADKVREALTQPVPFGALQLRCGASIGIGRYPADGTTVGELLSAADRAMYEVKHASPQAAGLPQPTPAADPDLH
jgi:diguanylate cyclase (GGDEF)-like protein